MQQTKIGHAWILYLKEKDNQWYGLDGTWYPERSRSAYLLNVPHRYSVEYVQNGMWWSTNEVWSWSQHDMTILNEKGEVIEV